MFASKNAILKKSFDVRILFFASKNAILTKAFEAIIAFLHRRMSILKEAVEARISFLHRKMQFRRGVLRPESHFCVKRVDLEEGFYGFRVGSGRSVGRRFAFSTSSASHQRHLSSSSLYMVKKVLSENEKICY